MSKISTYVENVFASLPKTEQAEDVKLHIIESMEDKYDALCAEGKSENEALGEVLGDFGSIDELREALGGTAPCPAEEDTAFTAEYEAWRKTFAAAIALGVGLCIAACAVIILTENIPFLSTLGEIVFLLIVALAVFIFIYFGIRNGKYEERKAAQAPQAAPPAPQDKNGLAERLSGLVMLCCTLLFFVAGVFFGKWHPAWVMFPLGGCACGILGILLGKKE